MYVILSWGKMLLFDEPYHVTVVEKKGLYFQTQALQSFNTLLLCAASYLCIYFFNRADQTLSSPHKRRKLLINSPWHFIPNCMNCYRCAAYVCTSVHLHGLPLQRHHVWVFCLFSLVSIVHDRLNIVSREESSDAVADAFEPAIVVLLDYVDDGPFHEGQLVLLVLGVVVNGHNCGKWKKQ